MRQTMTRWFGGALVLLGLAVALPAQDKAAPKAQEKSARVPAVLPPGIKLVRDVAYVEGGGPRQTLDLYLDQNATGPLPLIIWVHGGGWEAGSKEGAGPVRLLLLGKGYHVASINYRLSKQAPFPAQIEDCKAAVRWLRAHAAEYHFDPDRFGVWGASAGGHLVALLGTSGGVKELEGNLGNPGVSSRVQAVCDWFGPADFLAMVEGTGAGSRVDRDSALSRLFGGPVTEHKDLAKQASPVTFATSDDPPFLIMQGDQDNLVPLRQSELLHEALKKAGVESTLYVVKGGGHGRPGFDTPEVRQTIEEFFAKHLKAKAK
jgi:acetyl esterase/lipase